MESALIAYGEMSQDQFEREFDKYVNKLEKDPKLLVNRLSLSAQERNVDKSFLYKSERVQILCRDCGAKICNGSEIKYRDPNYVCENRVLSERVRTNDKKFFCSKKLCNKELGKLMDLKKSSSLCILDIKGVKFELPDSDVKVISKWSKANEFFYISTF